MNITDEINKVLDERERKAAEHRRWRELHPSEAFAEDVRKAEALLPPKTPAQVARAEHEAKLDAEIERCRAATQVAQRALAAAIDAEYGALLKVGTSTAYRQDSRAVLDARTALEVAEQAEGQARVRRTTL